jgi:hypothetical protein
MTRAEHLAWCKERALAYIGINNSDALASMLSDLGKHTETNGHAAIPLGVMMAAMGQLENDDEMRKFIEGFH